MTEEQEQTRMLNDIKEETMRIVNDIKEETELSRVVYDIILYDIYNVAIRTRLLESIETKERFLNIKKRIHVLLVSLQYKHETLIEHNPKLKRIVKACSTCASKYEPFCGYLLDFIYPHQQSCFIKIKQE